MSVLRLVEAVARRLRYTDAVRWLIGGLLVIGTLGCTELTLDPARGYRAPVVESYDATIDEDAAIPDVPPDPVPDWAEDEVPPPAFPPPAVD